MGYKNTMNKILIFALIAVVINFFSLSPVFSSGLITSSTTLSAQGVIQLPASSAIHGADISINVLYPSSANYIPTAWQVIEGLGINELRCFVGMEGDVWGLDMNTHTNWAQNLDAFLTLASSHNVKVVFYELGTQWGGMLGIIPPTAGTPTPIASAKLMIDKLAGNNALNHDFITDSRIGYWSISNEVDFGDPASPNAAYTWTIQMCDYIRSKGGKVAVPYPRINGGWEQYFNKIEPLLRGHVDYLETHVYEIWQLANYYSLGNNQYNWAGWKATTKSALQNIMTYRGSFDMEHLIIGEFGIWRDTGSDAGLTNYVFTGDNRRDYYTNFFNAFNELGLKNWCIHDLFVERNRAAGFANYGVVNSNGQWFPYLENIIKAQI